MNDKTKRERDREREGQRERDRERETERERRRERDDACTKYSIEIKIFYKEEYTKMRDKQLCSFYSAPYGTEPYSIAKQI